MKLKTNMMRTVVSVFLVTLFAACSADEETELLNELYYAGSGVPKVRQVEPDPTASKEVSWDWKLLPQVIESSRIADQIKVARASLKEREISRVERLDEGGYQSVETEFYDEHGVIRIRKYIDASEHHFILSTIYLSDSGKVALETTEHNSWNPYGIQNTSRFYDSSGSLVWAVQFTENDYYNPNDDYPEIKDADGSVCSVRMGVDVGDGSPIAAQFIVEHDDWNHDKPHCDWREPE